MRKWSYEEEMLLLSTYRHTSREALSKTLGRTWMSIKRKAQRLGLKRSRVIYTDPIAVPDVEWAYLAGLIDGEGSISIGWNSARRNWSPRLTIYNTSRELLENIRTLLGRGYIVTVNFKNSSFKHNRPVYQFGLSRYFDMIQVLKGVMPYLKLKRKHAELMLKFLHIMVNKKWKCKPGTSRRVKDTPGEEVEIYRELKKLNAWK